MRCYRNLSSDTEVRVLVRTVFLLVALAVLVSNAWAENPWEPDCKTVKQCIIYLEGIPECVEPISICVENRDNDGLDEEFTKFKRSAVPPLLKLLESGKPTVASRSAQILWSLGEHLVAEDRTVIFDAWDRNIYWTEVLVSRVSTPDFAQKVLTAYKTASNSEQRLKAKWTLSNLRDWEESSSDIAKVIAEAIECSERQPCDPVFAKHQFDWLLSNYRPGLNIHPRIGQALENPKLDIHAQMAALRFFAPTEAMQTERQLVISVLEQLLLSSKKELRDFAAVVLAMYGVDRSK